MINMIRLDRELENFDYARMPIKASERAAGDIPYLGASGEVDRVDGYTHNGDYLCVSEDGENLRSRNTPIAWVQQGKFWANNHLHVLGGLPIARLRFYEAALAVAPIGSYITGSAQPKLSQAALHSIEVPSFCPTGQVAIGEVLGALIDKIAANQQVIGGTDGFLAALFGSHLARSATVKLQEVASVNRRAVTPTAGGEVDYLDIGSVREGAFDAPTRMAWSEAPSRARRGLDRGDVLWSTVRPNRRSHALNLGSGKGAVVSTGLAVLSPVSLSPVELYEATKRPAFQEYLESVAEGSAYPAVRSSLFNDAPLTVLEGDGRQRFVDVAAPLRELQWSLREENLRLAATRDELLPLLMNGKITVKDAEKIVEDVV